MNAPPSPVILGIDPGTRVTGYGVIGTAGGSTTCIEYGVIRNTQRLTPWECHVRIYDGIEKIVTSYAVTSVAVESQFFSKNPQSTLRIGEARSAAVLPATRAGLAISEYAPRRVKQAVVGTGTARKEQVQHMVRMILSLADDNIPEDAADALAIALCHLHALSHPAARV